MSTTSDPKQFDGSPCPTCGFRRTLHTFDHAGERFFFCTDCQQSWAAKRDEENGSVRLLKTSKPK